MSALPTIRELAQGAPLRDLRDACSDFLTQDQDAQGLGLSFSDRVDLLTAFVALRVSVECIKRDLAAPLAPAESSCFVCDGALPTDHVPTVNLAGRPMCDACADECFDARPGWR